MKNFIKLIKQKDKRITASYINQELKNFESILEQLEIEHQKIKDDVSTINYLLDLIEKHQIDAAETNNEFQVKSTDKNWLKELTNTFEKFHLMSSGKLSSKDITYLKAEKAKLLSEKQRLEKEHKSIHELIAKTSVLLMDVRETVCNELSKGHHIADVGEKLLENFGKEVKGESDYNSGKGKIIHFLEDTFLINKIQSKGIFDLLEKSNVVEYTTEVSNINFNNYIGDYYYFSNYHYIPLTGTWHINS